MTIKIPVPAPTRKEFKLVPPGAHFARCVQVIDLGVQAGSWQGKPKLSPKVYLKFEIPDETVEWTDRDGKEHAGPMTIGATYTLSLGEKAALRRDLENWRGESFTDEQIANFDIATLAGRFCQVTVNHKKGADGKTYANLSGIMGLSKDQKERAKTHQGSGEILVYTPLAHDEATFQKLPEWLQKRIGERVVTETAQAPDDGAEQFDDSIPF